MATKKTITVTIDPKGELLINAEGFTGDACLKETKSIEEALGKVGSRILKPEAKEIISTEKAKVG